MLKRYLVFSGDVYYAAGGWSDFKGSFDLIAEAREHAGAETWSGSWSQVIDSHTGKEIADSADDGPGEPVNDQFGEPLTEEQQQEVARARAIMDKLRPPPAPGLSAVSVARAFEVMLPAHNGSLTLRHNPHKTFGHAPMVYLAMGGGRDSFISPVEKQKSEATDELWLLSFMPHTGEALRTSVSAATLPALAQWLQDNGLAFGS